MLIANRRTLIRLLRYAIFYAGNDIKELEIEVSEPNETGKATLGIGNVEMTVSSTMTSLTSFIHIDELNRFRNEIEVAEDNGVDIEITIHQADNLRFALNLAQ